MKSLFAVATNTFYENLQNKVLYIFLGLAVLFLFISSCMFSGQMNVNGQVLDPRQIAGFASTVAYGLVTFFGLLITIMLSMGILPGELESGSIVFQLTRPIGRSRFLLGKLLGTFYTIAVATFALTSGYYLLLAARARVFYPGLYFGWALALLDLAVMLLFVALFTLLVPRVVAGLFGFLLFFASLIIGIEPLKQYCLSDQANLPTKTIFIISSVFIPHLEDLWSIGKGLATRASLTPLELLPILYVALYALALASIALVLFQKRDL